ncbi:MAG: UDP-N-acetylglucosamine 1-carboxyvinyltransferase [Desulfurivibrionaceae bacterium]
MDKIVVQGGKKLEGEIAISGSKNAALPIMAATLLCPGVHTLRNVPALRDIGTMLDLLAHLGAVWERRQGGELVIDSSEVNSVEAPYDMVRKMRASVLVLGPLLARFGQARVSLPGGCAIGARPINYHMEGLARLGAEVSLEEGYVTAESSGPLTGGGTVYFDVPSVTGTENILMAACLARGKTTIKNAAREPEIGNLIDMLSGMGAAIEGRDSDRLVVHGGTGLSPADIEIIPDRIETGTYLIAVGAAGGEARITDCRPSHLPSLLEKLAEAGLEMESSDTSIRVRRRSPLKSVDVKTMVYPGFPTDLQAQIMALMTLTDGVSVIDETIFENRFMHVAELNRMGADIRVDGGRAVVRGSTTLKGAPVMATDLRASASLVVAALSARGRTEISRVYHLDRGYVDLVAKLTGIGADIKRVKAD